ncbi:uncharacterized protein LOC143218887 [Lasioglossum baleicum]|uniref:uncharacterized protein LOC143218887 n=1 Tax=Lasioglossum baleicum TaxID=434251 RepID=UPI003FCDF4F8
MSNSDRNTDSNAALAAQLEETRRELAIIRASMANLASTSSSSEGVTQVAVAKIPKIPTFSRKNPVLWFHQIEASRRRANVSSETAKFDYLATSLDDDAMINISDIVVKEPPYPDMFTRAKARLIKVYASTDEENLRKLLRGQVNVDCRPSQILRQLRDLNAACRCTDTVLRQIFLEQLSEHQREVLIATKFNDLDKVAEIANKLVAISSSPSRVCAASSDSPTPKFSSGSSNPIDNRFQRIESLLKAIASKLNAHSGQDKGTRRAPSAARSPSHSRQFRSKSPSSSQRRSSLCYAHSRYPHNPTSCKPDCPKFEEFSASKN